MGEITNHVKYLFRMTLIFRFITKKFNQNFIYVESICCRKQDITLGQSQIFKTKFGVPPNFPVTAINIVNLSCGLNLEMGGLSIYFFPVFVIYIEKTSQFPSFNIDTRVKYAVMLVKTHFKIQDSRSRSTKKRMKCAC